MHSIYYSRITFSAIEHEFQPVNSVQLILVTIAKSRTMCSVACNEQPFCRTLDYDSASGRCRLFEADETTGSIISSTSPTSIVGTVSISSLEFVHIHNESCKACQQDRYEYCPINGNTCQCWPHTFWNGSVCLLQLFENGTCSQLDACRDDFNLTCATEMGQFTICTSDLTTLDSTVITSMTSTTPIWMSTAIATTTDQVTTTEIPTSTQRITTVSVQQNITTVAGSWNGSCAALSGGMTTLHTQGGITVSPDGTLYVADGNPIYAVLAFKPNNFTAKQIMSFSDWPAFMFFDSRTSSLYVTVFYLYYARVWPSNQTIPSGTTGSCAATQLLWPTGIVVDSLGNIYITSSGCHVVIKWNSNATIATVAAGSLSVSGTDNYHFNQPYGLFLDANDSLLYVADFNNHRIQKFILGNSAGVTVAGGNGQGSASNQLNRPTTIYVSQQDDSYYICDYHNNRIQRWAINATYGVTIAGSSAGVAGSALNLLNAPYDIWVHPNKTFMLVSDSNNCRIQKYILY
ncbi:unnamed protein product [Adineta ricciae]|uniref:Apple domain-containing protein n=1 Tax=Adineta ricciae TaxID=249248 RepID=A0A816AS81_ADIRI|nr:unnamed protein product [Adineta ricciae]CAF1601223.1 unnamed protein product [Adineta ricciae]